MGSTPEASSTLSSRYAVSPDPGASKNGTGNVTGSTAMPSAHDARTGNEAKVRAITINLRKPATRIGALPSNAVHLLNDECKLGFLRADLRRQARGIWARIFPQRAILGEAFVEFADGDPMRAGDHSIPWFKGRELESPIGLELARGRSAVALRLELDDTLGHGLPLVGDLALDRDQRG